MTDREHEHWKDIQGSSHKEKLEYLLSLTKPGKNYFITPHYHSKDALKEFIDITELDLERRAVEFNYINKVYKAELLGLNYTTDYEFIIWNGKMYRGYIETNVCIDDPEEFKRLAFDFHKYQIEKNLDILE
jgi:hypothetical protein